MDPKKTFQNRINQKRGLSFFSAKQHFIPNHRSLSEFNKYIITSSHEFDNTKLEISKYPEVEEYFSQKKLSESFNEGSLPFLSTANSCTEATPNLKPILKSAGVHKSPGNVTKKVQFTSNLEECSLLPNLSSEKWDSNCSNFTENRM